MEFFVFLGCIAGVWAVVATAGWFIASDRADQAERDAADAEEELDRLKTMLRLLAPPDDEDDD